MPSFRNVQMRSIPDSPIVVGPHKIIFGPPLPKIEGHGRVVKRSHRSTASTSTNNSTSTSTRNGTGTSTGSSAFDDDTDVDMAEPHPAYLTRPQSNSTELVDILLPRSIDRLMELRQHDQDRESEFFRFFQRKAKNVGLPRALMIFSRSHAGEVEPFPMPRIYQFADMLHLVRCFRDAVKDHRRMWLDGILHHDVTVYTILLGRVDAPVGLCGKLCRSKDPIYVNPMDPRVPLETEDSEPHPDTQRLSFKSVMQLNHINEPESYWPPEDHLDDMESLLYVLAWIAGYMDGPQRLHFTTDVLEWETATPVASSTEKQSLLRSPMLTHLNTYFWRPAFWRMYSRLAEICMNRLRTKYSIIQMVDSGEYDCFPSLQDTRRHFGALDHDRFLAVIDQAVAEMEMSPDDNDHIKARPRPAFTFADLRAMSNTHQKRPRARQLSEADEFERQVTAELGRRLDKTASETLGMPFPPTEDSI